MAISRKRKIIIIASIILILGTVITVSVLSGNKEIPEVQTDKIKRVQLLESKVTASGEVRPIKFFNITAEVPGRVTNIFVKEGDAVKKDQPLVSVDPTQIRSQRDIQAASLNASQAETNSARVQVAAAENNVNQAKANLLAAQADYDRTHADFILAEAEYKRNADLIEQGIISRSQFDTAKARYEAAKATLRSQEARITALKAQVREAEIAVERARAVLASSEARVKQSLASLQSQEDLLSKTTKRSPIDGVVSSMTVREGEYVVANFTSSALMIIADMSEINVEVKVDETDIANVRKGNPVKVKVDALGDREIIGEVSEVAASAITRSGQTIAQSQGSQEAKDFKVVVRLNIDDELRSKLRPGMSATAVITTQTKENVLAIPLQALVVRDQSELENKDNQPQNAGVTANGAEKQKKKEVQGVFVVNSNNKAIFTPVETGITGETNIEVISGLNEGDEIIIGPFRQLRTLKTDTTIKREAPGKKDAGAK